MCLIITLLEWVMVERLIDLQKCWKVAEKNICLISIFIVG